MAVAMSSLSWSKDATSWRRRRRRWRRSGRRASNGGGLGGGDGWRWCRWHGWRRRVCGWWRRRRSRRSLQEVGDGGGEEGEGGDGGGGRWRRVAVASAVVRVAAKGEAAWRRHRWWRKGQQRYVIDLIALPPLRVGRAAAAGHNVELRTVRRREPILFYWSVDIGSDLRLDDHA